MGGVFNIFPTPLSSPGPPHPPPPLPSPPPRLLKVIWTQHLSMDYALFVALAIIDMQMGELHNSKFDFSDIIEVCL